MNILRKVFKISYNTVLFFSVYIFFTSSLFAQISNESKTVDNNSGKELIIDEGEFLKKLNEEKVTYRENVGQIIDTDGELRPDVLFTTHKNGVTAYLKTNGISYVFERYSTTNNSPTTSQIESNSEGHSFTEYENVQESSFLEMHRIDLILIDANSEAEIVKEIPSSTYDNFYLGHCKVDHVRSYDKITYKNIYPNIDMVVYTLNGNMKYDFIIYPGGNPSAIKVKIEGTNDFGLTEEGSLELNSKLGNVIEQAPFSYQMGNTEILSSYKLENNILTFNIEDYDHNEILTIDPTRQWGTFYTSTTAVSLWNYGQDVAADASGVLYAINTNSATYPASVGVHDETANGNYDIRVGKFDPNGNLLWGTYFGGNSTDYMPAIEVGPNNTFVMSGATVSNNLPVTLGAYDATYNSGYDFFITKFTGSGMLTWCTYFGGNADDRYASGIDVNNNGEIAFYGTTISTDMPMLNSYDNTFSGSTDLVVAKFSSLGDLQWSTFFGEGGNELANRHGIQFDNADNVVVLSKTNGTIPVTPGVFLSTKPGAYDLFLTSFTANGSGLNYSTYIGSNAHDGSPNNLDYGDNTVFGMDICSDNSVVVGTASWSSTSVVWAATPGSYSNLNHGGTDSYILKFDNTGNRLWGTTWGGNTNDFLLDIAVNGNDDVLVLTSTNSTDFQTTTDGHQLTQPGSWSKHIGQLNSSGTTLLYGSYLGSSVLEDPYVGSLAYNSGSVYLGMTSSSGAFNSAGMTSTGAYQESSIGGSGRYPVLNKIRFCDIIITDVISEATCLTGSDGAIDITAVSTLENPLSYVWSNSQVTQDVTGLVEGNYSVVVTGGVSGCSVTQNFSVGTFDSTPPVAVCQDISVYLDLSGNATLTASDIDNGSSDNCDILSLIASQTAFTCVDLGSNPVNLSVTDYHTNSTGCLSTVTVLDTLVPTAICQDLAVTIDGTGTASVTAAQVDNGSNDDCGPVILGVANVGTICFTVLENNWLTVTAPVGTVFTSVDFASYGTPIGSCGNFTYGFCHAASSLSVIEGYVLGQNSAVIPVANGAFGDPCGGTPKRLYIQLSYSSAYGPTANFTCEDVGPSLVSLLVTDGSGNTSTCLSTVNITEVIPPVAVCQDITVQLDATGNVTITGADIDAGSSDNCAIVSLTPSQTTFDCNDLGPNTVVLTVMDENGNSSTCSSIVTVENNVMPTAACQDINVYLDGAGNASIVASDIENGSNVSCGIMTLSASQTTFTCANIGANSVTLTVTDVNTNTDNCISTVTVMDTISPTVICQDITIALNAVTGLASIVAGDVNNGSTDACGIATMSLSQTDFDCSDVGTNTVTLTVTDVNGNVSTCTSIVTITEATLPTAVCQDITVQLDVAGNVTISAADIDNGSSDNCGIASLAISETTFDCNDIGANLVTLTVTDNNGNVSTCTATVTVEDIIGPTIVCQDITVQLDATGNVAITAADIDNNSTDACGIASIVASETTFDCSDLGTNLITLTITDSHGNVSTCTSTVTVEDNVNPTAVCQDITLILDPTTGLASIVAGDIDNGSSDNCGIASVVASQTDFDCSDLGTNLITLTVTDNSGNASICTSTILVEDNVDPTAICQDITVQLDSDGNATITGVDVDNGSNDVCGILSLTVSPSVFDCSHIGANLVTLTVTDNNGNVSTCTSTVLVEDTIRPNVVCQDINVYLDGAGTATIVAGILDGGSTDACGVLSITASQTTFDCSNLGVNNVTLVVTDMYNNVDSCLAIVTVLDTIAPIVMCQTDFEQYLASNCEFVLPSYMSTATFTDNCTPFSDLIITQSPMQGTVLSGSVAMQTISIIVEDNSGNIDSCNFVIQLMDTIPPTIICPSDQEVSTDYSCIYEIEDYTALATNGADNCNGDNITVTQYPEPGSAVTAELVNNDKHQGQTIVYIIVEDLAGNVDSCEFFVDVSCIDDLYIPGFFSPNADGKNDYFVIDGLENFLDNKIVIFNRWGNEVFRMKGYDNSWDGTSSGSITIGDGPLPTGTYYFVLDLGDGSTSKSGYIDLQR